MAKQVAEAATPQEIIKSMNTQVVYHETKDDITPTPAITSDTTPNETVAPTQNTTIAPTQNATLEPTADINNELKEYPSPIFETERI